ATRRGCSPPCAINLSRRWLSSRPLEQHAHARILNSDGLSSTQRGDIMTELTRRGALAATAAATLSPLAGTIPAKAAAPLSGQQAPGFYRFKVGSYECTVLLDGVRPVKLDNSPIRNANLDEVKSVLTASHLPTDQLGFYF